MLFCCLFDKVPTIFKHKAVPKPRVKSVLRAEKRKHDEARYVTNECFTMSLLFKSSITALKTFQSLSLLRKHIKHFLSALCLTVSMIINFIALDSHTNCQKLSQTLRCFLVYSVLTLTNKLKLNNYVTNPNCQNSFLIELLYLYLDLSDKHLQSQRSVMQLLEIATENSNIFYVCSRHTRSLSSTYNCRSQIFC